MKLKSIFLIVAALSSVAFTGCKNDDIYAADFDNSVFIDSKSTTSTFIFKAATKDFSQTLQVASAKKVDQKVTINYVIDQNMVSLYNVVYYDNAVMLPAECYEMPKTDAVMSANSALSTPVEVSFKQLGTLDRNTRYVLPVRLDKVIGANILPSAQNHYYVFKGGAMINVVGNIANNYLSIQWKKPEVVNGMKTMTAECLVRATAFDKEISTIMGIEDQFLIRCGDSGFPKGQVQIAYKGGKWPSADPAKALQVGKWVHVAFTYDNGSMKIYVDGKLQSEGTNNVGSISWGSASFFIGRSWDLSRWWDGEVSEMRVWNVVRTKEEIAANQYGVDPATPGLVAYWKFDEGTGGTIKDYTSNGNNAQAIYGLKWISVSLPTSGK